MTDARSLLTKEKILPPGWCDRGRQSPGIHCFLCHVPACVISSDSYILLLTQPLKEPSLSMGLFAQQVSLPGLRKALFIAAAHSSGQGLCLLSQLFLQSAVLTNWSSGLQLRQTERNALGVGGGGGGGAHLQPLHCTPTQVRTAKQNLRTLESSESPHDDGGRASGVWV